MNVPTHDHPSAHLRWEFIPAFAARVHGVLLHLLHPAVGDLTMFEFEIEEKLSDLVIELGVDGVVEKLMEMYPEQAGKITITKDTTLENIAKQIVRKFENQLRNDFDVTVVPMYAIGKELFNAEEMRVLHLPTSSETNFYDIELISREPSNIGAVGVKIEVGPESMIDPCIECISIPPHCESCSVRNCRHCDPASESACDDCNIGHGLYVRMENG